MSNSEIGALVVTLCIMIPLIHIVGHLFEKMKQPQLVGEILSGVVLGPFFLGRLAPNLFSILFGQNIDGVNKIEIVLNFIYWIGLFLLMFLSGSETRKLLIKENHRETAWLVGLGTPLPFLFVLGLGLSGFIPLEFIVGGSGQSTSALLILAIAVAVTSIPVISRIFYDLKILHTRFAGLILGSAVLEDIILWGVLAVATSIAATSTLPQDKMIMIKEIFSHVFVTFMYMGIGLILAPRMLKKIHDGRWNYLIRYSPVAYLFFILFLYTSLAFLLGVNLVFASFLAGFGVVGGIGGLQRDRFTSSLESISKVATGVFIPIYFSIVGYKLVFGRDFSIPLFLIFLFGSSLISFISVGLAAWMAGFRKLDILNLVITTNARGGPGIVLASVAYDAGIINAAFYTTLVLTAVITSQMAGSWLRYILSKGRPLLASHPYETWTKGNILSD